jgi:tRNA1Val (adenine37-N6)-methyltransferase
MPNTYFQFKQFKIEQDKCAMKVCTDSCLFGAWISVDETINSILDIGTGTGLLSLMLAQKLSAQIDAIEIDENACQQAKENFNRSVWKDRLNVLAGDIRTMEFPKKYDMIVCNPPFYQDELSSDLHEEKIAKHSLHLSLTELISSIEKSLNTNGKFAILLPYYRKTAFEQLAAQYHFFPEKTMLIKHAASHDFFRYAGMFSSSVKTDVKEEIITIKTMHQHYTPEAIQLLQPYYLYL